MNEKNDADKRKRAAEAAAAGRARMARMLAGGAAQPQNAASSSSMDVEDDQAAAAEAAPTVAAQQGSDAAGVGLCGGEAGAAAAQGQQACRRVACRAGAPGAARRALHPPLWHPSPKPGAWRVIARPVPLTLSIEHLIF